MTDKIKSMINNLSLGKNAEAQTDFKSALADKVAAAIDGRREDVASSLFSQQPAEAPSEAPAPEVSNDEVSQ